MILQEFTTPEEDRNLIIEKIKDHEIWLTFNGKLIKTAKTMKGVEKEKQRLIKDWKLVEVDINK